jgi:hypothetical protein
MTPTLCGSIRLPRFPGLECPNKGVVSAVLSRGLVTQDSVKRVHDPVIARPIQAVEVIQ